MLSPEPVHMSNATSSAETWMKAATISLTRLALASHSWRIVLSPVVSNMYHWSTYSP